MKIVLNREEIKQLRKLANTLDSIEGTPVKQYLEDFKVTKKAYVMAMITGELTIDVEPNMITGFTELLNNFMVEVSPFMTALIGLYKAMMPACDKYDSKFQEFFNKYRETPPTAWEIKSISTERVEEIEREVV